MKCFLLTLSWLFLVGWSCAAQNPLPADGSFSARGHVYFMPDSGRTRSIDAIRRQHGRFRPVETTIPQYGKGQPAYWFRALVVNPLNQPQTYVAEIDYAFLDTVRFFLLAANGRLLQQSKPVGWRSPMEEHVDLHRNPLFRFSLSPHQSAWLYSRAEAGNNRLTVPLRFWTESAFVANDRWERSFWSWTIGALSSVLLLSLILFSVLKERVYGYYALLVMANLVYLTASKGFFLEWITLRDYGLVTAINLRHLANHGQVVLVALFIRWYMLPSVITSRRIQLVYKIALAAACLDFILICLSKILQPFYEAYLLWTSFLFTACFIVPVLLIFGLVCWLALQSKKEVQADAVTAARVYALAITPAMIHVVLSIFRNYNLIADHYLLRLEGTAIICWIEFLIIAIGLGYRYKRMVDERQQLTDETHRQQQQAAHNQYELQHQKLRAIEAQLRLQQEKERIARDLHDHVGSQLSVIATNLDHVGTQIDYAANTARVSAISGYAREAIQSLRDTIWAIHQEQVTLLEFRLKLQQYLQRYQELVGGCRVLLEVTGVNYQTAGNWLLTSVEALNLFRIVQEALTNAIKYAQATEITVTYTLKRNVLSLLVKDNGIGFVVDQTTDEKPHYGLENLRRRAIDMGATCSIESQVGRGTTVTIVILLPELPVCESDTMPDTAILTKNTAIAV